MGSVENKLEGLRQAVPAIKLVEPSNDEYEQARLNTMGRGADQTPLCFAYPQTDQEVADLVRWAKSSQTEFCIRSGGNDFYGRSLLDDGLIIDMRAFKSVTVGDDKKTVKLGGGILAVELLEAVEAEGLVLPFGNVGWLGYVGWVTLGGYGPLTNSLGMGFEGIVGAELVNADGEVIEATEEMLEALRGLGGNIGVITSLTIKAYPARKFLNGPIVMDYSATNIKAVMEAAKSLEGISAAVLQHVVMSSPPDMSKKNFTTLFSWDGEDLSKGHALLDEFIKAISPVQVNMVKEVTGAEFTNGPKYPSLPYGGVRSVVTDGMSSELTKVIIDGAESKSAWGNITWTDRYKLDHSKLPKNTFAAGDHAFITWSDIAPDSKGHDESKVWADGFEAALKKTKVYTAMTYPPLTVPGSRTAKEMMGDKYERARELKQKYDPENVFKHAVPRLVE